MIKSQSTLYCRCCGKPIRKWTVTVYVKDKPSDYDAVRDYCRYVYGTLHDLADCQRHTNKRVVSVQYHQRWEAGEKLPRGPVYLFHEWDGETYYDDAFCGTKCAAEFGRGVARTTNFATQAWRDAMGRPAKKRA